MQFEWCFVVSLDQLGFLASLAQVIVHLGDGCVMLAIAALGVLHKHLKLSMILDVDKEHDGNELGVD